MKIFLDTANVDEIKKWAETGIIDGVTTNPTHLSHEGKKPKDLIIKICKLLPKGEISVEVTKEKPDEVYKQAREIAKLGKNILVKIPCHVDYYPVIKKLIADGVKLNITLVFTLIQALMMCKLGATYISPFVGRWDDIDVDSIPFLMQMRAMIDEQGYETGILAASIRSVRQFHDAIVAGSDAITLPESTLKKAVDHPLTSRGMEKFLEDWKKIGVKQFP